MPAYKRICFTINNYTDDDQERVRRFARDCEYLIVGREVGESGTPHLQGFAILRRPTGFRELRRVLPRAHLESTRAGSSVAANYCRKDGDFDEFGELPTESKSKLEVAHDWINAFIDEHRRAPTAGEMAASPVVSRAYIGHLKNMRAYAIDRASALAPTDFAPEGTIRPGWQEELRDLLDTEPDDRTVTFVVGPTGGEGKSWFQRWFFSQNPERTQLLGIGKRDDIAHTIDTEKDVFLMDVSRTSMEFLNYSLLENLKDRKVFSPKYDSQMKILRKTPHVVVFSNEEPDMTKLSADRYNIILV